VAVGHRDGIAECEVAGVRESLCRFPRNFKFFSCLSFAAFSIMSCKRSGSSNLVSRVQGFTNVDLTQTFKAPFSGVKALHSVTTTHQSGCHRSRFSEDKNNNFGSFSIICKWQKRHHGER